MDRLRGKTGGVKSWTSRRNRCLEPICSAGGGGGGVAYPIEPASKRRDQLQAHDSTCLTGRNTEILSGKKSLSLAQEAGTQPTQPAGQPFLGLKRESGVGHAWQDRPRAMSCGCLDTKQRATPARVRTTVSAHCLAAVSRLWCTRMLLADLAFCGSFSEGALAQ